MLKEEDILGKTKLMDSRSSLTNALVPLGLALLIEAAKSDLRYVELFYGLKEWIFVLLPLISVTHHALPSNAPYLFVLLDTTQEGRNGLLFV